MYGESYTDIEEVKPFLVIKKCLKCKIEMKPTGLSLLSSPPQFPHKCPRCGYEENFSKVYPCLEYEPVNK